MNKRNNNRPRPNGVRVNRPNHSNNFSSPVKDDRNELRLKNRGHYQQMYDKYSNLAREALSLGDRIEAEGHFQHAEHYLRQLNERIRYDQEQQHHQQQHQRQQQQIAAAQQNQASHNDHHQQNPDAVEPLRTPTQPRQNPERIHVVLPSSNDVSENQDIQSDEHQTLENEKPRQPRRRIMRPRKPISNDAPSEAISEEISS
jgi:hypothetical protein